LPRGGAAIDAQSRTDWKQKAHTFATWLFLILILAMVVNGFTLGGYGFPCLGVTLVRLFVLPIMAYYHPLVSWLFVLQEFRAEGPEPRDVDRSDRRGPRVPDRLPDCCPGLRDSGAASGVARHPVELIDGRSGDLQRSRGLRPSLRPFTLLDVKAQIISMHSDTLWGRAGRHNLMVPEASGFMGVNRVFDPLCNLAETCGQHDRLGGLCEAALGAERITEIRGFLHIE
jgi:hypothetical protein